VIGPTPPSVPAQPSIIGSALAVVNLGAQTATLWLYLYEEEGSYYWVKSVDLAPGEQLARFIDELFDDKSAYRPLDTPRGTIKVSSNQPVAAILIKTVNGLPVSILPLGSRED
jgi:hypothetical protein